MIKVKLIHNYNTYTFKVLEVLTRTGFLKISRKKRYYTEHKIFSTQVPHSGIWMYIRIDNNGATFKLCDKKEKTIMLNNVHIYRTNKKFEISVECDNETFIEIKNMFEAVHNECVAFLSAIK